MIRQDPNEDELKRRLSGFGVQEDMVKTLLRDKEPFLLIAVTDWLMGLSPGFKNVRIIRGIASVVEGDGRDHETNCAYLKQNSTIPKVSPNILEKKKIVQFFSVARTIIECETGLYKPQNPSPKHTHGKNPLK